MPVMDRELFSEELSNLEKELAEEQLALLEDNLGLEKILREHKLVSYDARRHPKQWILHTTRKKKIAFIAGNRAGKTCGGAVEVIWNLLGNHPYKEVPPPPVRWRGLSVSLPEGKSEPHVQRDKIKEWMPRSSLYGGSWDKAYNAHSKTLHCSNGSFLQFMSYDQDVDKQSGDALHGVWFDEEPPKEHYIENMMRLIDYGGTCLLTMTPVNGMTWVYEDIYLKGLLEPEASGIELIEADTLDNPFLDPIEVEAITRDLTEDEKKVRLHGKFVRRQGLVWKDFDPDPKEGYIVPVFDIPLSWKRLRILDHGLSNPTAVLWAAVDGDDNFWFYDEHYKSGMTVARHKPVIWEKSSGERWRGRSIADPSIFAKNQQDSATGKVFSIADDYATKINRGTGKQEHTFTWEPADNSWDEGVNRVQWFFENKKIKILEGRCPNLVRELLNLTWDKKSGLHDKERFDPACDDHACDDLRYAIMTRQRGFRKQTVSELHNTISYQMQRMRQELSKKATLERILGKKKYA